MFSSRTGYLPRQFQLSVVNKQQLYGPVNYRGFRERAPGLTRVLFLKRPGNFSDPKVNFEIKTCWVVAHKPVNFARKVIVSLYHFQNYWNFDLECKRRKHKQLLEPEKLRDFEETGPLSRGTVSVILSRQHIFLPVAGTNFPSFVRDSSQWGGEI